MSEPFRRSLSDAAFEHALRLREVMRDWTKRSGNSVELRRADAVMFYRNGSRVHVVNPSASTSPEQLAEELRVEASNSSKGELFAQAQLVSGDSGFVVLDQQVAVPSAALADTSLVLHRVDLLLLEVSAGALWLAELKLATGDDLHEAVPQLELTSQLPGALKDPSGFVGEYRRVLAQKQKLGLLAPTLSITTDAVATALIIVGDRNQADARIVCWPSSPPEGLWCAFAHKQLPSRSSYSSLSTTLAEARSNPRRSGFAPRRSRHTEFAAAEDLRTGHLPPNAEVEAYFTQHSVAEHSHRSHPRSSQRLCTEVFGPARRSESGALGALSLAFREVADRAGLSSLEFTALDFEAPHFNCRATGCRMTLDVSQALGEGSKHTSLDVLLTGRAHRDGRAVSVCVGVEFKYTEPEFGACGGFVSSANESPSTCLAHPGGKDRACRLLEIRRTYLTPEVRRAWFRRDPLGSAGICELLGPQNQLFRSHFTTEAMAEKLEADESLFVVVWHEGNRALFEPEPSIPGIPAFTVGPAERYRQSLVPERAKRFGLVGLSQVIGAYRQLAQPPWLAPLTARYGL
ncbi:MAG: hypothetical protein QM817_23710 [Archangium sp.]